MAAVCEGCGYLSLVTYNALNFIFFFLQSFFTNPRVYRTTSQINSKCNACKSRRKAYSAGFNGLMQNDIRSFKRNASKNSRKADTRFRR